MKRVRWGILVAALVGIVYLGWSLLRASTAPEIDLAPERAPGRSDRPTSMLPPDAPSETKRVPPNDPRRAEGNFDAGAAFKQMLATNAEAAARNVDRFCELNRSLSKAFTSPPKIKGDAALFLVNRVDWEGGRLGSLHLPKSLTDRMNDGAWVRMGPSDYAGFDFGWMTALLEFDSWSISGTGPVHDVDALPFYEAPIPNFVSLTQWEKLRLVKGLREGDSARASQEVRHLAELCGSTNVLLGEMIRSAMYRHERAFYEQLGLPVPEGLPNADDAETYRRAAYAGMYFLYPGVPKTVRAQALACSVARCSAMTEALGLNAAARDVVPEARETMSWLLTQSPCDPALAEQISKSPAADEVRLASQMREMVGLDDLLSFDAGM